MKSLESLGVNNIAIIDVKGIAYRCIIYGVNKSFRKFCT